jgi:hypothetical protein
VQEHCGDHELGGPAVEGAEHEPELDVFHDHHDGVVRGRRVALRGGAGGRRGVVEPEQRACDRSDQIRDDRQRPERV